MSLRILFDLELGIVRARIDGVPSLTEIAAALAEHLDAGPLPADAPSLWDLRELDFPSLDRRFTERMVEVRADEPRRRGARIALLVADDLGFGMMRMYVLLSDPLGQEMAVFRDEAAAERWLCGD